MSTAAGVSSHPFNHGERERVLGLSDDTDLMLAESEEAGYLAVTEVDGSPAQPNVDIEQCAHNEAIMVETVTAFIKDGEVVTDWQVRLRAQCGGCGAKFFIDPAGRTPRDGGPGVVHSMRPVVE